MSFVVRLNLFYIQSHGELSKPNIPQTETIMKPQRGISYCPSSVAGFHLVSLMANYLFFELSDHPALSFSADALSKVNVVCVCLDLEHFRKKVQVDASFSWEIYNCYCCYRRLLDWFCLVIRYGTLRKKIVLQPWIFVIFLGVIFWN